MVTEQKIRKKEGKPTQLLKKNVYYTLSVYQLTLKTYCLKNI